MDLRPLSRSAACLLSALVVIAAGAIATTAHALETDLSRAQVKICRDGIERSIPVAAAQAPVARSASVCSQPSRMTVVTCVGRIVDGRCVKAAGTDPGVRTEVPLSACLGANAGPDCTAEMKACASAVNQVITATCNAADINLGLSRGTVSAWVQACAGTDQQACSQLSQHAPLAQ